MASKSAEYILRDLFSKAGIEMGGSRPWDIEVHNEKFYSRTLAGGSLAFGESYMDGWWDCDALDQLTYKTLNANLLTEIKTSPKFIWRFIRARLFNLQSSSRVYVVGKRHYDIGNGLFKYMLDSRMNYSCGYWKNAEDLEEAQEAKLDLICRKLKLQEGMHILDIGCGWGGFARYAAEKYKVRVTGITVSAQQQKLATELCKGLKVNIALMDYRDLKHKKFDAIVSVGMFEHVGYKNFRTYFEVVDRCLNSNSLLLLHTIGGNESSKSTNPWIDKYIFPNSMIPSAKQITTACEGIFKIEDWHNFGFDYDKTIMAWYQNFNGHWKCLEETYSDRFRRMWNYYLLTSAGSFRAGRNQLWQIVLSQPRSNKPYESIR